MKRFSRLASCLLLAGLAGCNGRRSTGPDSPTATVSPVDGTPSGPVAVPASAEQSSADAPLPTGSGPAGADCRQHEECTSGVCNHYKKDLGRCAPAPCQPGERADNNHFFCAKEATWKRSRQPGESCKADVECFQPTCFMIPSCDMTAIPRTKAVCRHGSCAHQVAADPCAAQGHRRVLDKGEYQVAADGSCMESMAQRLLRTVCAPCGNGTCDTQVESPCNCPEDCAKPAPAR